MTLRSRVALALLTITLILVSPAVYGLITLWQLHGIAQNLRTRDAVAALSLGRLQTALSEASRWQSNYLPIVITGSAEERASTEAQIEAHLADFEAQLDSLAAAQYATILQATRQRWEELMVAMHEERRLIDAGELDLAEGHREQAVEPAFNAVDAALHQVGQEINRVGEVELRRAQLLAETSATTTLIALALALALAVLIAGWLTRSLLRPIHELRSGMSVVAAGEFEPDVHIPPDRPDELGDLARSFQRMTKQLAELDRLKAEFVSVASHELKTPLSVIKGYVSLLQDGIYGDVPEEQHKVLASVSEQTDRLGRLIQQLLDISRFEAGGGRIEVLPIDLRPFLEELITSFEALAVPNQIDFGLETGDDLPETVLADPDRLNEVLGNLLSNAFKFTLRGGRIRLLAEREKGGVAFVVQDTGVGVPKDDLPRIFEKFYQVESEAHPKSMGSGLGLAISREIVEAHGGTISAESQVSEGTTFRVFLPQNADSV